VAATTSFHEAGQAVAAILLGRGLVKATIGAEPPPRVDEAARLA